MSAAIEENDQRVSEEELLRQAVGLLCQQIWCWGRDILRAEGNWLVEVGFERTEAPADRERCSSVYTLKLAQDRRVVLRGFGVFYGDERFGGVFLPRYEFRPRYTTGATLDCPPWTNADLPEMGAPSESERDACASLTLDLIDWIRGYEVAVVERLGIGYRRSTLEKWDNGKRPVVPAVEMASAWRSLGVAVAENTEAVIPRR